MSRLRQPWLGCQRMRRSWPLRRSGPEATTGTGPGAGASCAARSCEEGEVMARLGARQVPASAATTLTPLPTPDTRAEHPRRMPDSHPLAYLDAPDAVDRFLDEIAGTRELALDTEGASFHRFVDRIYLLQLSTRDRSAIIDPLPVGKPAGLGRLIESADVEKVFHDADYDLRLLHQDYGWTVRRVFDTRVAAQLVGLKA